MDNIKKALSNLMSNKRNVISALIVGITVLSIPVAVQLVQQQQILKSRAADPEQGLYFIRDGTETKTVAQMRTELRNAGWPAQDYNRPPKELYYLYNRNGPARVMNCAVNKGDLNNMPTQIQAINPGDRVNVTIVQKWEDEPSRIKEDYNRNKYTEHQQWKCNEWYPNVKFTNRTTGHVFDHLCTNANYENHFNQERPDEQNPGLYNTFSPLDQVRTCFVNAPSETGTYQVEVFYTDRNDPKRTETNISGDPEGCVTPVGGVRSFCPFTVVQSQGGPGGGGGTPGSPGGGGTGAGYAVAGQLKNPAGAPVPAINVEVHNDKGEKRSVQTGSDGKFTVDNFIQRGSLYAVRIPDNKGKTTGGDHTWISCNNVNSDTPPNQGAYECQLAGSNDCSGSGFNGQSGRCNFTYESQGQGGPGASTRAGPSTGTVTPASFPRGSSVTFNATSQNADSILVQIIRDDGNGRELGTIPSSRFGQNVQFTVPPDYPTGTAFIRFYGRKSGLDQEQPTTQTTVTVTESTGSCVPGTVGCVIPPTAPPTTSPTTPPTTPPTVFVTDTVKVVEDNTRNSILVDDPIWENRNIVTERKYPEIAGKRVPFTLHERVCVTAPCDTFPNGDRWVHVLFIGHDAAGNVVKKSESKNIYLALLPKIENVSCETSPTGDLSVSVSGVHFGSNKGSVRLGNQNAPAAATTWTNLSIKTTFPNQTVSSSNEVTITTPEGAADTRACTLNKSQVDFTASLACRSVSKPLSAASIEIKEALTSAVVFPNQNVNFTGSGRPQGLLPELTESKDYRMVIQAPSALRVVKNFTAKKGTTVLEAMDMPLGDIAPERPDCKINASDVSRMFSEWTLSADATNRRSDLNQDGKVNTFDYACMRSNYNKECDPL